MATSTENSVFTNLTYIDNIKQQILTSGGTIVFMKDNVLVATEVSESQYRELLNSTYIDKIDVLPLKRYANTGIQYTQSDTLGTSGTSGASSIV